MLAVRDGLHPRVEVGEELEERPQAAAAAVHGPPAHRQGVAGDLRAVRHHERQEGAQSGAHEPAEDGLCEGAAAGAGDRAAHGPRWRRLAAAGALPQAADAAAAAPRPHPAGAAGATTTAAAATTAAESGGHAPLQGSRAGTCGTGIGGRGRPVPQILGPFQVRGRPGRGRFESGGRSAGGPPAADADAAAPGPVAGAHDAFLAAALPVPTGHGAGGRRQGAGGGRRGQFGRAGAAGGRSAETVFVGHDSVEFAATGPRGHELEDVICRRRVSYYVKEREGVLCNFTTVWTIYLWFLNTEAL